MGFDSGAATFQMLDMPRPFPDDWLERFAERAGDGVDSIKGEESLGWVTGRHLLDTTITEDPINSEIKFERNSCLGVALFLQK